MPRKRNTVSMPELTAMINTGGKRYLRKDEAQSVYSLGRHTFEKLAKEANAVIHYGNSVLYDTKRINSYLEAFYDNAE